MNFNEVQSMCEKKRDALQISPLIFGLKVGFYSKFKLFDKYLFKNADVILLIERNASFDQPSPERLDHHILLIANMVMGSIKTGRRWSPTAACPL